MQTGTLEMHGLGSIEVVWQFDNGVLSVNGTGKNFSIQKKDVVLVKYPARNKALIRFGNDGEHRLLLSFPNVRGLLHEQWGEFPEKEINSGRIVGPVLMMLSSGIVLLIAAVMLFYFWGIPWLVDKAVDLVPVEQEISLGKEISSGVFAQTPPDSAASARLNQFADEINFNSAYPLHFNVVRDSTVNAFALPGGEIVVYTGILDKLSTAGQLAALLAHEASHVAYRHSMHGIMDKILWSALLALAVGDGGIASAITAQSNEFRSLAYSRDLETQADTAGAAVLRRNNIGIHHMVALLEVLKQEAGDSNMPEFLQTHPLPESRIEALKELKTTDKELAENTRLDSLFRELKAVNF
jgi:Zn-dependent protease with chaperone function